MFLFSSFLHFLLPPPNLQIINQSPLSCTLTSMNSGYSVWSVPTVAVWPTLSLCLSASLFVFSPYLPFLHPSVSLFSSVSPFSPYPCLLLPPACLFFSVPTLVNLYLSVPVPSLPTFCWCLDASLVFLSDSQ